VIQTDGKIVIDRPADVAFDLAADERNEPRYNAGTRRVDAYEPRWQRR